MSEPGTLSGPKASFTQPLGRLLDIRAWYSKINGLQGVWTSARGLARFYQKSAWWKCHFWVNLVTRRAIWCQVKPSTFFTWREVSTLYRLSPIIWRMNVNLYLSPLCARASRTILGHVPIGEYRARFFPNEPTACPFRGMDLETRMHILRECPRYTKDRIPSQVPSLKNLIQFLTSNPIAVAFPTREPPERAVYKEKPITTKHNHTN